MATRPASKLNLQEFGVQDEIELVDKQGRADLASLTQRVDDITPPDNIDISEDGVKVYANYDVNELGWGCEDKTYYFDTAAEFSLGDRTYTKTNAKPAFGGVIGTPGDGQNHAIVLVSTEADATYFSWNNTAYSFDYNGTTWYYCGGNYAYWGSPATGISVIPDGTLSLEDAARYMLDSAQVYVDDGKFSEIAEPNSGYLFAGGGSQYDYSDATFKVSKDGVVTTQDVEINGESITDKIDGIIDDTTSSTDSTWSSSKITEEIEDKTSVTKTAEGNPIEITDGADAPLVKCVTEIQGSQDLHGHDKPWVGGAGKNICFYNGENNKVIAYCKSGVTYTFSALFDESTGCVLRKNTQSGDSVALMNGTGSVSTTFTADEDFNLFLNGYSGFAGKATNLQLEQGSVATSYAPYSNICPIMAYTEGEIEVRGKNMFNQSNPNKWINADGDLINDTGSIVSQLLVAHPNQEYILSSSNSTSILCICFYDNSMTKLLRVAQSGVGQLTATAPNGSAFMYAGSYQSNNNLQLELGSTPTTYEPYVGTTHTTTYPSAIYRGSEDVVKGEVTGEWGYSKGGTRGSIDSSGKLYKIADLNDSEFTQSGDVANMISSHLPVLSLEGARAADYPSICKYGVTAYIGGFVGNENALDALLPDLEVAYKLATPTTSSVTPTNLPIRTLSGYNHIESSTGDMEIEYITEDYQPLVDLIEDNAVSDMTGATSSTDGTHGLVPAPEAGDEDKFLKGDGTWGEAGGNIVYSSTPKIVGKWVDGVTDVYEVTMVTNHVNPTGTDYSYFPDTFSKIISVTGSISGQVAGSSRYYAPMGGWFKQSNDNINIDCSVYLGNFGPDNVRVYYAFHDQSTITPGGMSCDEQTIVVRYLR